MVALEQRQMVGLFVQVLVINKQMKKIIFLVIASMVLLGAFYLWERDANTVAGQLDVPINVITLDTVFI